MGGIPAITDPTGTNGASPTPWRVVADVPCASAVAAKDLVAFTIADDGEMTCAKADTDVHTTAVAVGVALEAGVTAGDIVQCVVQGPAIVNTPATGPSVGELMILTSTAGTADGVAADATTVVGTTHGVFMTDEIGTTNTCWVWVSN